MIGSDLSAFGVSLAMAALSHHPIALVALIGVGSVCSAPFEPASAAALPNVVAEAEIARANSLVAATSSAGYLVGPLLGGVVLGLGASAATLFVVDAGTFLVSAVLIWSVRRPFGRGATDTHPGLLAGARVIAGEKALRITVLAAMVSLLAIGIVNVAAYPLSLQLGSGATGYGAMTGLLGGGGLVGAALAGRLLRLGTVRVLVGAFAAGAIGLTLAGAAPVLAVSLVGMALAGAGRGLGDVAAVTLIQARAADAVRGRVFAAEDGAAHVAFSVSAFGGGLLVQLVSVRGAFVVAAACAASAALLAARVPAD
jgi:MFS family permease